MAVILGRKVRVVWDNPAIIKDKSFRVCVGSPIVRPCILWIAIFNKGGLFTKLFGIAFTTLSINHARGIKMSWTTWTMHHTGGNSLVKEGINFRIRDLSRDDGVNGNRIIGFIIGVKEDEDMGMRKATFLEFNGINMGNHFSKNTIFDNVF